jgi:Lrp/AsnC family leucine-responsive transcriptional regulator
MTFAELGRQVSLSPPAVGERVRRLEKLGVITGYHATVDVAKLGFPLQAVVRIVASARVSEMLARKLEQTPEVLECHQVTGQDSFVLRLAVRSVEHLGEILHRLAPHDGDTITAVVLRTTVAHRVVTRQMAAGSES